MAKIKIVKGKASPTKQNFHKLAISTLPYLNMALLIAISLRVFHVI